MSVNQRSEAANARGNQCPISDPAQRHNDQHVFSPNSLAQDKCVFRADRDLERHHGNEADKHLKRHSGTLNHHMHANDLNAQIVIANF